MTFEHLYNSLMGYIENPDIPSEFEGACGLLYEESYTLRLSLCEKLDGNLEGESKEILQLIELYEEMQRLLCEKCYEYGFAEGFKQGRRVSKRME